MIHSGARKIFIFDTCVIIDYLKDEKNAADVFARASEIGEIHITIISLLELYGYGSKNKVKEDFQKLEDLQKSYNIKFVSIPEQAQDFALTIAEYHYAHWDNESIVTDFLILSYGIRENTFLVTEDKKWFKLIDDNRLGRRLRILHPADIIENPVELFNSNENPR